MCQSTAGLARTSDPLLAVLVKWPYKQVQFKQSDILLLLVYEILFPFILFIKLNRFSSNFLPLVVSAPRQKVPPVRGGDEKAIPQ